MTSQPSQSPTSAVTDRRLAGSNRRFRRLPLRAQPSRPTNHAARRIDARDAAPNGESLFKRRKKTLWLVPGAAGATGSASSAPTTGLEIPEQAAVAELRHLGRAPTFLAEAPA